MNTTQSATAQTLVPVINVRLGDRLINVAGTCIACSRFVSEADGNMVVLYGETVLCESDALAEGWDW